jgi:hypothetical protein
MLRDKQMPTRTRSKMTFIAILFFAALGAVLPEGLHAATSVAITNFRGAWVSTASYSAGAVVTYNGASYICIVKNTNVQPTNATDWSILDAPGAPGAPGAAGPAGSPGPQGPAGATGATGSQGAMGAPGPMGPAGAPGAMGPAGVQGVAGSTGAAGSPGPAGPQGPRGATGPQGPASAGGILVLDSNGTTIGKFTFAYGSQSQPAVLMSIGNVGPFIVALDSSVGSQTGLLVNSGMFFAHAAPDCSDARVLFVESPFSPLHTVGPVYGALPGYLIYPSGPVQTASIAAQEFVSSDLNQPGTCQTYGQANAIAVAPVGVVSISDLGFVPPFHLQ